MSKASKARKQAAKAASQKAQTQQHAKGSAAVAPPAPPVPPRRIVESRAAEAALKSAAAVEVQAAAPKAAATAAKPKAPKAPKPTGLEPETAEEAASTVINIHDIRWVLREFARELGFTPEALARYDALESNADRRLMFATCARYAAAVAELNDPPQTAARAAEINQPDMGVSAEQRGFAAPLPGPDGKLHSAETAAKMLAAKAAKEAKAAEAKAKAAAKPPVKVEPALETQLAASLTAKTA